MTTQTKHLVVVNGNTITFPSPPVVILLALVTYAALVIFVAMDIYAWIFQNTYFKAHGIPTIDRNDYVRVDRHKLLKLTTTQKINCLYCGYANSVVAYFKAVTNRMEEYSCAILHAKRSKSEDHQKNFYKYEAFN